jgi:predicted acyltransferase
MPDLAAKTVRTSAPTAAVPPAPSATPAPATRVGALDALRGFDMFWIVGGDKLAIAVIGLFPTAAWTVEAERQLHHMLWDGFTAWDLIMPLFLFVVGAVMPFSFARRLELGHSKRQLYFKIIRRTLILFVLGMAVQGHLLDFNLSTLHVFANTLQAIAVGYFIAGILMLTTPVWGQVVAAIVLMIGYWLLLMYVPVRGHGAGVLEQHANIALTVDRWVMGRFIDGTDPPYTWVLSGMTFTATVLLGVFSGYILGGRFSSFMKFIWLTLLGAACLAGGWAWAEYLHFPIIKHVWTSSMVLWAAGWSYLLLAAFYLLIDVAGFRRWAFPFIVIGMNAITIYVAYDSKIIPFNEISNNLVGGLTHHLGPAGPLVIALTTVLLVWLPLYHMYRHKIFIRI